MKFLEDLLKPIESFADNLFEEGWIGWLGIGALIIGGLYLLFRLIIA